MKDRKKTLGKLSDEENKLLIKLDQAQETQGNNDQLVLQPICKTTGPFIKVLNYSALESVLISDKISITRMGSEAYSTVAFKFKLRHGVKECEHTAQLTFYANQRPGIEFCFGEIFTISF